MASTEIEPERKGPMENEAVRMEPQSNEVARMGPHQISPLMGTQFQALVNKNIYFTRNTSAYSILAEVFGRPSAGCQRTTPRAFLPVRIIQEVPARTSLEGQDITNSFEENNNMGGNVAPNTAWLREHLKLRYITLKKSRYDLASSMTSFDVPAQFAHLNLHISQRCGNSGLIADLVSREFQQMRTNWCQVRHSLQDLKGSLISPFASEVVKCLFIRKVDFRCLKHHLSKLGPYPELYSKGLFALPGMSFDETMWLNFFLCHSIDDYHDEGSMLQILQRALGGPQHCQRSILSKLHGSRIPHFMALAQYTSGIEMSNLRGDSDTPGVSTITIQPTVASPAVAPPGGTVGVATTAANNTAIESSVVDEQAEFVEVGPDSQLADEFEDHPSRSDTLTSRYVEFFNMNVNTTAVRGAILASINMPDVLLAANMATPNALFFKQYEWYRASLHIKVQTNCSKFQQYAVLVSAIYGALERDSISDIIDLPTLSTMPSVLINGSFSTSVELNVPFMHAQHMIPTGLNTQTRNINFVTLVVSLVSPLMVAPGTPSSVNLRFFGAMRDVKFYGQRGFYQPIPAIPCAPALRADMLKAVVAKELVTNLALPIITELKEKTFKCINSAERVLLTTMQDMNRDKPIVTDRHFIIQTTGQDMASGSGKCNATTLRLNSLGTTPHCKSDVGVDNKFGIDALKQVFGLVGIFTWNSTSASGTRLWSSAVQPGPGVQELNLLPGFPMAPVDHLSTMFATYRGSVHFKFIVITNGIATGKLRVTFEPGVSTTSRCDVDSVPYVTFDLGSDLGSNTIFQFAAPYQYMQHQFVMRDTLAPTFNNGRITAGNVAAWVEIPLVTTSAIPPMVEILVYKCADSNVEFGVPRNDITFFVAPIDDEPNPPPVPDPIVPGPPPLPPVNPIVSRVGLRSRQANRNAPWNQIQLNFGSVVTPTLLAPTGNTLIFICSPSVNWTTITGGVQANAVTPLQFWFSSLTGSTYRFRAVIGTNVIADQNRSISQNWGWEDDGVSTSAVTWITGVTTAANNALPFNALRGDGDPRFEPAPNLEQPCPSGRQILPIANGEVHDVLYDVLRRMEMWTQFKLEVTPTFSADSWDISMPASMGAPCFRNQAPMWMRTNKITKIADMFRFSRGGIRLCMVVSSDTPAALEGTIMEVVHVPFAYPNFDRNTQVGSVSVESYGYAVQAFSLKQNNVNTIEVPHYNIGSWNYNSSFLSTFPNTRRMCSLGSVFVRFRGPRQSINLVVYRALADDARFYVFNGSPARAFTTANMTPYYTNGVRPIVPASTSDENWQRDLTSEGVEPNPGPILSKMRGDGRYDFLFGRKRMNEVDQLVGSVSQTMPKIGEAVDKVNEMLSASEKFGNVLKLADVGTQVMHVVVNPVMSTFLLSLGSIICKVHPSIIGSGATALTGGALSSAKRVWRAVASGLRGDGISDEIWSFICTIGGVKFNRPAGLGQAFAAVARCATMGEKVIVLFKTIFQHLHAFAVKMMRKINPQWLIAQSLLAEDLEELCTKFLEYGAVYCSPDNMMCIRNNPILAENIVAFSKHGLALEATLNNIDIKHRYLPGIKTINTKLDKTIREILTCANQPHVKYEPFVLYVSSSPGVGKSYQMQKIVEQLLQRVGKQITPGAVHVRSPSSEYWDGYHEGTVVVSYDDFMSSKDDRGMLDLKELIQMKTAAVLIGNFSDVSEKQKAIEPMIITICSNSTMPTHADIVDSDAVFRRRDELVMFETSKNFKRCARCQQAGEREAKGMACSECREVNRLLIDAGEHIMVTRLSPKTGSHIAAPRPFCEWQEQLVARFDEYHKNEKENVKRRLETLVNLAQKTQHLELPGNAPIKGNPEQMLGIDAQMTELLGEFVVENGKIVQRIGKVGTAWVAAKGIMSTVDMKWSGAVGTTKNFLETKRLEMNPLFESSKSFLKELQSATVKYDIEEAEKKMLGMRVDTSDCEPSTSKKIDILQEPTKRADGLVADIAATVIATTVGYGIGIAVPKLVRKVKKCSHTIPNHLISSAEVISGWLVYEGKKYLWECDDCFVDNPYAVRNAEAATTVPPCVCSLVTSVKSYRMGSYLWADGFVYVNVCNACNIEGKARFINGRTQRMLHNLTVDPDVRKKNIYDKKKRYYMWHACYLAVSTVLSIISTLSLYHSLPADMRGDKGGTKDYSKQREKPKAPSAKFSRLRRADGASFDMVAYIRRHQIMIHTELGDRIRVLMIGGRKGIATRHQIELLQQQEECTIDCLGETFKLSPSNIQVEFVQTEAGALVDLSVITFPGRVNSFTSIAAHFLGEDQFENRSTNIALFKFGGEIEMIAGVEAETVEVEADHLSPPGILQGLKYCAGDIKVSHDYYKGACGTVAIDALHSKILGIHVASDNFGFNKCGYVQIISKEFVSEHIQLDVQPMVDESGDMAYGTTFIEGVGEIELDYNQRVNLLQKETLLAPLQHVKIIGSIPSPLYHIAHSSIVRSPMCGVLSEPVKFPVIFDVVGEKVRGVSAMRSAIEKNKPSANFSGKHFEKAKTDIRNEIVASMKPLTTVHHIRTVDEAVNGNSDVAHFGPMDMSTAPGYPAKIKHTQKKTMFVTIDGRRVPGADLAGRHEKNMLMRYSGVKPTTIFACSLKDERLPEGKAPRLIQGAPVEFVMASRRLTMDFASAFYSSALNGFSAVGMNCMGSDWAKLAGKMKWKNTIMAGDVKSFGPTLDQSVVEAAYDMINAWYDHHGKDDKTGSICRKARRALLSEVLQSWNIAYDTVFQTMSCSPTGQPLTVIINTICLYIYLYVCWLSVMEKAKRDDLANYLSFKKNLTIFAYGDDFLMSVHPDVKAIWNNKVLQEELQGYGISYTGTNKEDVVPRFETIEQTSFLGRRFVKVGDIPAGALRLSVINDVPNWMNKKHMNDNDDVMYSMCVGLLQEFVFHGKETYNVALAKLQAYWTKKKKPLIDMDWDTMHAKWLRDDMLEAFPELYYPRFY